MTDQKIYKEMKIYSSSFSILIKTIIDIIISIIKSIMNGERQEIVLTDILQFYLFDIDYKEANNIPLKLFSKFENNMEQKV